MRSRRLQVVLVSLGALIFWLFVSVSGGVREPWDAPTYWTFAYPLALAASAVLGFFSRLQPWLVGVLLVVTQLPVIVVGAGIGSLIWAGAGFTCLLAIPAIILAWAGRRLRRLRLR